MDRPQLLITPLLLIIVQLYSALHQLALPRTRWIIIGMHVLLLVAIGATQGVLVDNEALKYTGCARSVLHGDFTDLTGNYLKYAGYILFLLPFVIIDSLWITILAQVILGILAAEALARFTERISGNVALGRVAMALFLLCPPIQHWALALYTEHFFTCMSILFVERLDRSPSADTATIGLGLLALFARPVGMFFVVPALLWKFRTRIPAPFSRWAFAVACLALFAAAISVPRIAAPQLEPIASGQVIAGVGGVGAEGSTGTTIMDAQRHLLDRVGPSEWAGITLRRVGSLFNLTRPWYSTAHNAINALFFALYPLAGLGIVRNRRSERVHLVLVILALNIALVGLTHDEWSGRFLAPLLPWVIVLASVGLRPGAHRSIP